MTGLSEASRWRQLPLPFPHEPQFVAADLLAAPSNGDALAWLSPAATWPQDRLALWGPEGCGKTHLLHVWSARVGARLLFGAALPAEPERQSGGIAVDDADTAPERALLHLLNTCAEARQPVLLAARAAPARWATGLADLASRLRATTAVEIRAPDDSLLRALLARLLYERKLAVAEPVQDWLRLRLPRTPAAMREVAARLDRAALATGGRVTRALAADVARTMAVPDPSDPATATHCEDFARGAPAASSAAPCLL